MLNVVHAPTVNNRLRHVAMPQFDHGVLISFSNCHFHDGFVKSFALFKKNISQIQIVVCLSFLVLGRCSGHRMVARWAVGQSMGKAAKHRFLRLSGKHVCSESSTILARTEQCKYESLLPINVSFDARSCWPQSTETKKSPTCTMLASSSCSSNVRH